MDVEDENVLKIIFKESFPDSLRENPDVTLYLSALSSYGLERINKEPEVIAEDKAAILEQTQDLVFHNYKTFIQTAECSKEIFKDFNKIEEHLNEVSSHLPNFIEKCQEFSKKSQEINTSRRLNSLTLTKHPQLLEVLEMPQLMDTCVRNSYYDEALELSAYVFRLEKKYSSIPIIQSIAKDVQDSMKLMLNQLVQQLRTNAQLPLCLKVIGYLRRMDVFSEEELRIKFLQARDAWFQSILHSIPTNDPYQHITKIIEVSRVHLFDIMTQYRAIFADDDPMLIGLKDSGQNKGAVLHGWVVKKISQFLEMLKLDLTKDMGGRVESLLGQCMYFGLSFSRVGADFRSLLVPLFEDFALRNFKKAIDRTSEKFADAMQSFIMTTPPTMHVSSVLAASTAAQDKLHPPLCLLEFLPLVELCNNILASFNDLRLLAPVSIFQDVTCLLTSCLCSTSKTILDYYKAEEGAQTTREKEAFLKFCHYYGLELVPYLDRCLQALFPRQQLAQVLGISIAEFNKLDTLGCLENNVIVEQISFLLPEPEKDTKQVTDAALPAVDENEKVIEPTNDLITEDSTTIVEPLDDKTDTIPTVLDGKLSSDDEDIPIVSADDEEIKTDIGEDEETSTQVHSSTSE